MKRTGWMIVLASNTLQAVQLGEQVDVRFESHWNAETVSSVAEELQTCLRQLGYRGEAIVLALDARLCFPIWTTLASKKQLRKPNAILFQLEEALPDSAEEIVASWEVQGKSLFAVAAHLAPLKDWIERLEQQGIPVASVAPLTLLAVAQHVAQHPPLQPQVIVWYYGQQAEVVLHDRSGTQAWLVTEADTALLGTNLAVVQSDHSEELPCFVYATDSERATSTIAAGPRTKPVDLVPASLLEMAALRAQLILAGIGAAPLELRHGPLGTADRLRGIRRELTVLSLAISLLLVALGGVGTWRANRYEQIAQEAYEAQRELYQSLFPKTSVPAAITGRLTSEKTRLAALRSDATLLPQKAPGLSYLEAVLRGLPTELRYRVLGLRVEDDRILLEGEVRSHTDADQLANALTGAGLTVSAPITHKLASEGFSVHLAATFATPSPSQPQLPQPQQAQPQEPQP